MGDIIGVKGEVFRTKTGELSVRATELTLLAKSLRPLPEKFHGLTDTEMRYRQLLAVVHLGGRAGETAGAIVCRGIRCERLSLIHI